MNAYIQELRATAKAMVTEGKGILAMDEQRHLHKRLAKEVRMPICHSTETPYDQGDGAAHIGKYS